MHREQKKSLFGILIFGGVMLAAVVLFAFHSPAAIQENRVVEVTYVMLLIGSMIAYGIVLLLTGQKEADEAVKADERDVEIARRALSAQLSSVLATVTLWCVALGLLYMDHHEVPLALVYLMVNSVFVVNLLAKSIAIYRGYLIPLAR